MFRNYIKYGVGCIIDLETTGLTSKDEILEFAGIKFSFDPKTGEIIGIIDKYSGLREPNCEINIIASRKTHGLSIHDVKGESLDLKQIAGLAYNTDFLVMHNGKFDSRYLSVFSDFVGMPYYCTMAGINWKEYGFLNCNLSNLCALHDIDFQPHRAMNDAEAVFRLLNCRSPKGNTYLMELLKNQQIDIIRPRNELPLNIQQKNRLITNADVAKAINTLSGIIQGVSADGIINALEMAEIENWLEHHSLFLEKPFFRELVDLLNEALYDGFLSLKEKTNLIWLCSNYTNNTDYNNLVTADIQRLHGIIHGIIADRQLNDLEIRALEEWLGENEHLMGIYPYDELSALLTGILKDHFITEDERKMLMAFCSTFIDPRLSKNFTSNEIEALRKEFTLDGICAVCPDIQFLNKVFSFTGESTKMSRNDIQKLIENKGGLFSNSVTKKTDYLIVGNNGSPYWTFSCYGRKVEQAVKLRKKGHPILIVNEIDFWDSF